MKLNGSQLSWWSGLSILVAALVGMAGFFYWAIHPEGGGLVTYRWQANQPILFINHRHL